MKDQAMFDILNKFSEAAPDVKLEPLRAEDAPLTESQLPQELMREPVYTPVEEAVTREDTIADKFNLSDMLSKMDREKMDDLRPAAKDTGLGPCIKTMKTQDGKVVKIHGNEDDGFRVALQGKPHKAVFKTVERAIMACESYVKKKDVEFLESKQ